MSDLLGNLIRVLRAKRRYLNFCLLGVIAVFKCYKSLYFNGKVRRPLESNLDEEKKMHYKSSLSFTISSPQVSHKSHAKVELTCDFQYTGNVDILILEYTSTRTSLFCRKEFLRIAAQRDGNEGKELEGFLDAFPFTQPRGTDYFEIDVNGEIYLMPRSSFVRKGHVFYPINETVHSKLWRFGKKINCLNLTVNRTTTDSHRKIALMDIEKLADLRDLFIRYGGIPILMDGTLLGWYRECSIIPHTKDVDIAIFQQDFPFILGETLPDLGLTWLYRDAILGRPNDNYILKLKIYGQTSFIVDTYALYLDEKENISFTTAFDPGDFAKLKTTYPRLDTLCAVDLLNHIFHVPCNTVDYLLVEFGSNWTVDRPSSQYHWRNAPLNTKTYGYFNRSERSEIMRVFSEYPRQRKQNNGIKPATKMKLKFPG